MNMGMNMKMRFRRLHWQEWVIFFFVLPLLFTGPARAGDYLQSAHGSNSYGVSRPVMATAGYARGNCANCHEQHASVGGSEPAPASGWASSFLLFADSTTPYLSQSKNVCFYCHTSSSSLQVGGITNYDFSKTFGGATATITGIQEAFNITSPSSNHNLADIYDYITGTDTHGDTKSFADFPPSSSPCSGCHNVHIAKRNKSHRADPNYTAISKPSDHGKLWGDSSGETLWDYTKSYQPPYYSGSTGYEPDDGSIPSSGPGSNMPDYVTFCTDCHNNLNSTIYSSTISGGGRTLIQIDWSSTGDYHGTVAGAGAGTRVLKAPFSSSTNYVLSCLDCHEPHGSPNITLLRRRVNGGDLAGAITTALADPPGTGTNYSNKELGYLCMRCHQQDNSTVSATIPPKWENVHHWVTNRPYFRGWGCACHGGGGPWWKPIACDKCHFHGGTDAWLGSRATGRKTF